MKLILMFFLIIFSSIRPQPVLAAVIDGSSPETAVSQLFTDSKINFLLNTNLTSVTGIINALLTPLLTLAGLILFAMIIWGGFQMLTAGTNPKAAEAGKTRLTNAAIGFIIIFAAYWITQILEIIFGINILK